MLIISTAFRLILATFGGWGDLNLFSAIFIVQLLCFGILWRLVFAKDVLNPVQHAPERRVAFWAVTLALFFLNLPVGFAMLRWPDVACTVTCAIFTIVALLAWNRA